MLLMCSLYIYITKVFVTLVAKMFVIYIAKISC